MRAVAEKGFTLVELLLVVALLGLTVGITSDLLVSLIRSYSKTQITNEIEQTANFVLLKLENELRTAVSVSVPAVDEAGSTLTFVREEGDTEVTVSYDIITDTGDMERSEDGGTGVSLLNVESVSGVQLEAGSSYFERLGESPDIVHIVLVFRQTGTPGTLFTNSVEIESTVVLRGSY
jgi:prepilin-type N-terminal cleavage/methylation domain-containing protein